MRSIRIHLLARPIHKAASGGRFLLLTFLFLSFILAVKAQSGFVGRIVLNIDDPAVTATVDKPQAVEGEPVTLTLSGLGARQSAVVTAGLSASASDYPLEKKSDDVYTFLMPFGTIYINVRIETSGYLIRVQTPGVSSSLAGVKLETADANGGWSVVEAGSTPILEGARVRASLTLPTEDKGTFSLLGLAGYATDGSWSLLPAGGVDASKAVAFDMPASDVVLRYTIGYEAKIADEPKADGPKEPKVEVPEIVWPDNPGTPEKPVLVITKEIEEKHQQSLSERLTEVAPDDPETVTELVDISLQLSDGERVQPGEGQVVTVTYPYPQGTDGTWNFKILHMISDDPSKPVAFEVIYPESLYIGLRFQVSSFSPFCIIYTPPVVPEGGGEPVRVTGIKLSTASIGMKPGESQKLEAGFEPADATDQRVEWISSDEGVATVSADGTVTAVAAGSARITARALNGGFSGACQVTVSDGGSEPEPGPDPDPDPDPDPEPPVGNEQIGSSEPHLSVSRGCLRITSPAPVSVRVYDLSGRPYKAAGPAESHLLSLPSGLWLVRLGDDKPAEKVVVP
ncbi:Ig-like domain-containing protein [Parabacteroides sp.]